MDRRQLIDRLNRVADALEGRGLVGLFPADVASLAAIEVRAIVKAIEPPPPRSDRIDLNAELLAGVREAEAMRRQTVAR